MDEKLALKLWQFPHFIIEMHDMRFLKPLNAPCRAS